MTGEQPWTGPAPLTGPASIANRAADAGPTPTKGCLENARSQAEASPCVSERDKYKGLRDQDEERSQEYDQVTSSSAGNLADHGQGPGAPYNDLDAGSLSGFHTAPSSPLDCGTPQRGPSNSETWFTEVVKRHGLVRGEPTLKRIRLLSTEFSPPGPPPGQRLFDAAPVLDMNHIRDLEPLKESGSESASVIPKSHHASEGRLLSPESNSRISDPHGWLDDDGVTLALRFFACCRQGLRTAAVFHQGEAPAPELMSLLRSWPGQGSLELVVPWNIGDRHWISSHITLETTSATINTTITTPTLSDWIAKVRYSDSISPPLQENPDICFKALLEGYFVSQVMPRCKNPIAAVEFTQDTSCPLQTNNYDCGIYTVVASLHRMAGSPVSAAAPVDAQLWRRFLALLDWTFQQQKPDASVDGHEEVEDRQSSASSLPPDLLDAQQKCVEHFIFPLYEKQQQQQQGPAPWTGGSVQDMLTYQTSMTAYTRRLQTHSLSVLAARVSAATAVQLAVQEINQLINWASQHAASKAANIWDLVAELSVVVKQRVDLQDMLLQQKAASSIGWTGAISDALLCTVGEDILVLRKRLAWWLRREADSQWTTAYLPVLKEVVAREVCLAGDVVRGYQCLVDTFVSSAAGA